MASLMFGVPELDRMLDLKRGPFYEEGVQDHDKLASIALLGPDGTGKSVLALHLVSRYYADSLTSANSPKVLYVSTDLRYEKAARMWQNFALNIPYKRDIPCERASDRKERKRKPEVPSFELTQLLPNTSGVAEFLDPRQSTGIGFIDLASSSAGDDWGYMVRAISLLDSDTPGHLIVIDSVAGFETLTGETDAYGEKSTRRARIAHVMRAAQNRCNIVFVVEESYEGSHLPEEFVADTVIRLRRRTVGGSMQRTLEIEKARGRAHASGEHPYSILDGLGSSTGIWENADEPRSNTDGESRTNNYIQIYYSLQYRNQRIKARPSSSTLDRVAKLAPFGIQHLDDMLAEEGEKKGLRCGKTCSLIGDSGTGKSTLAYSFLCEGFSYYAEHLILLTKAIEAGAFNDDSVKKVVGSISNWLSTTQNNGLPHLGHLFHNANSARTDFVDFVKDLDKAARRKVEERVLREKHDEVAQSSVLGEGNPLHISQTWEQPLPIDDSFEHFNHRTSKEYPRRRVQYPWAWSNHTPISAIDIADWLLRHPACASPAVLIATGDVTADDLAKRFVQWLSPVMESALISASTAMISTSTAISSSPSISDYRTRLFNYIAQHIICRRLETHDATAPILFHIIEWSILEAQRLLFGPVLPNTVEHRASESWRIRLVIDNFRIVRDMYPAVREDSLFLPFLTFYLGRDGVTSLIVDTDSGRPDKDPSDETNRELRSLVTHQLYTWQVPFFGQRRIAIAAVPPVSPKHKGIIREVKLATDLLSRPDVDPHFELYSGLEEGKPQAVSLEVRLYAETPAFKEYVRQENLFFRQVFPSMGHTGTISDVVVGSSTSDYEMLRDFCHMPTELRLNHSLVFQVDGFWSLLRGGSLENLYRYLIEPTTRRDGSPASMEDPFHLFQPIGQLLSQGRSNYFKNKYYNRRVRLSDGNAPDDEKLKVDRIPFTWDFGFLLCKLDPWTLAADKPLKTMIQSAVEQRAQGSMDEISVLNEEKEKLEKTITVRRVWETLPKTNDHLGNAGHTVSPATPGVDSDTMLNALQGQERNAASTSSNGLEPDFASWRAFLEAARVVADAAADRLGYPVQPFDFAAMTGDSVSSLILEMWLSEIWSRNTADRNSILKEISPAEYIEPKELSLVKLLSEKKSIWETYKNFKDDWVTWKKSWEEWKKSPSNPETEPQEPQLRDNLEGYSLELYMTWLLLLEVLDFSSFNHPNDPFDFQPDRTPVQEAVSARHWYKSACVAAGSGEKTGHPSELTVAVRLPGHFSVRGDWFLAIAKGSRSPRLAARALDVLSSRRANIMRLQMGLGLPTRDILDQSQVGQLRTGLRGPDSNGIIDNVKYENLFQKLAAKHGHANEQEPEIDSKDFYWLWRSGLRDYDRHSRPWRKWLKRLFLWTHHYHRQHSSGWLGGFKPYDQLQRGDYSKVVGFNSFLEFARMCDLLVAELKAAAPHEN